jgi:hypothetical protein
VTELDLRQSLIPVPLIEHLAKVMPKDTNGEGYDYHSFLAGVHEYTSNGGKNMSVEQTKVSGGMARGSRHYL